jgi:hypothetical protein
MRGGSESGDHASSFSRAFPVNQMLKCHIIHITNKPTLRDRAISGNSDPSARPANDIHQNFADRDELQHQQSKLRPSRLTVG